jgi:hypothetical protein
VFPWLYGKYPQKLKLYSPVCVENYKEMMLYSPGCMENNKEMELYSMGVMKITDK